MPTFLTPSTEGADVSSEKPVLVSGSKPSSSAPSSSLSEAVSAPSTLSKEEALAAFKANPVGFIELVLAHSAQQHLDTLKEQIELQSALQMARLQDDEFAKFEPFILNAVAQLIKEDADGILAPWPQLLAQAKARFQSQFKALLQQKPQLLDLLKANPDQVQTLVAPYLEGTGGKKTAALAPKFSRKQIAAMSLEEFAANEEAINQAMKEKRIY